MRLETPWFSTKEEAVINPINMGQSALVEGIVGGIMGGGTKILSGGVQLPKFNQKATIQAPIQTEQQQTAQQAPIQAPIGGKPQPLQRASLDAAPTTEPIGGQPTQQEFAPIGGEPISQPLELPDLPVRYNPNLKK